MTKRELRDFWFRRRRFTALSYAEMLVCAVLGTIIGLVMAHYV